MRKSTVAGLSLLAVCAIGLFFWLTADRRGPADAADSTPKAESAGLLVDASATAAPRVRTEDAPPAEEEPPEKTEEEKAEEAEEALVDAFDELTDKWMEPSKAGVSMQDVDAFVAQFRKVPKDRQDECLHRALNLVPDENVMLLAGILMDKSFGKDCLETVYNDILNRDESVKAPILKLIYKDKTHPCWADTAWILDVTGAK